MLQVLYGKYLGNSYNLHTTLLANNHNYSEPATTYSQIAAFLMETNHYR